VIAHPTGPSAASSSQPSPAQSTHSLPRPASKQETQLPKASPAPQPTEAPPPFKSMFDFVSPFDAFEKPKSQPAKDVPAPVKASSNGAPSPAPVAAQSQPPHPESPAPKVPSQLANVQHEPRQRQASGTGSQMSSGSKDLGLPWLTSKVVPKGTKGAG
jgi:hypothetical protein